MGHTDFLTQKIPLLLLFFSSFLGFSQGNNISVFLDCNCDKSFLRQEISYVDHVRDQALADIQLFIFDIKTGSGGRSYSLDFKGRNGFSEIHKKLVYETTPNMTDDEIRNGLAKKIELGLLSYLLESQMADDITFSFNTSENPKAQDSLPNDPWRYWIFEIYGEGEFEKESSRSNFKIELGYQGDKVTENWRIRTDIELNKSGSKYKSDGEEFSSEKEKYEFEGSVVRSLSDHWSTGIFSGIKRDIYNNQDLSLNLKPALEYNIFPYSEVLRREITFAYSIGYIYNQYLETTLFGKSDESLFSQSLNIETQFRQPWGNISAELTASTYMHDFSKNRVQFESDLDIRIFKGLAVQFSTEMELIKDQLILPAGDASLEDLLLQQRQIATDFEISFSIGLSYTFGSAYNNIINTRL